MKVTLALRICVQMHVMNTGNIIGATLWVYSVFSGVHFSCIILEKMRRKSLVRLHINADKGYRVKLQPCVKMLHRRKHHQIISTVLL